VATWDVAIAVLSRLGEVLPALRECWVARALLGPLVDVLEDFRLLRSQFEASTAVWKLLPLMAFESFPLLSTCYP